MSLDRQVREWQILERRTRRQGYFHFPAKSNPVTDRLLESYHRRYGEPFNLINVPEGARSSVDQ